MPGESFAEPVDSRDVINRRTVDIKLLVSKPHVIPVDSDADTDSDPDSKPTPELTDAGGL